MLLTIVAIVAVAGAGVFALYHHDMSEARRRLEGRSRIVETVAGPVEYAVLGQGAPMLVLHGATGGFDQGLDIAGVLAQHGFGLIAPSRFGYLRSPMPRAPTNALQADAYAQLLDRLGIAKAVVFGISAGAWSALEFAARYPGRCRALVLTVPAGPLPKSVLAQVRLMAKIFGISDFAGWTAMRLAALVPPLGAPMLGTPSRVLTSAPPEEKRRVRDFLLHSLPLAARFQGMQLDVRSAVHPDAIAFDRIACPVLAIGAEDDLFRTAARARQIAGAVPRGAVVIMPSGGHAMIGRRPDVVRSVVSFLSQAPT